MIDPNADPTLIVAHIIDPIGNRLAQFLIRKIMNQSLFRSCFGTPLLAVVAEVSHQFLRERYLNPILPPRIGSGKLLA